MKQVITLKVNGVIEEVNIEPWWTLSRVLREELGLIGTKEACSNGFCGSCTVLIDGKAVKSCLYLAMKARGKEIMTIEGLRGKDGGLHRLQKAFVQHFAVQCGYCTAGMIMAGKAMIDENPNASEGEIRAGLSGNVCRCTGYVKIVEAISAYAKETG